MTSRRFLRFAVVILFLSGATAPTLYAQGPLPDAPEPLSSLPQPSFIAPATSVAPIQTPSKADGQHPFWDLQNAALFTAVAATSGTDFVVTRNNLRSGGRELNPVVRLFGRSTPGLAVNFCGETVAVISLSYLFHRDRHHRLERAVSMVNIGISAGAVSFGLAHR